MAEKGPIYGVELIEDLPLGTGMMKQAMPSRDDLERVMDRNQRTVAGYEVLLAHYRASVKTVEQLADACEEAIGFIAAFMGIELYTEHGSRKAAENAKACLKKISDALVDAGRTGIRPEFFTEK